MYCFIQINKNFLKLLNHKINSFFLGDSNVIEVYIRYLRSKLEKPEIIKTKRGDGYILESDESRISKAASQTENNENLNF